jgi:hypothetical protein
LILGAVSVIFVDVNLKNEPNYQLFIVRGGSKTTKSTSASKIFTLEQVKLHIWLVWVDTQLEEVISDVSDAVLSHIC